MWKVTAEEGLNCTECSHGIHPGVECLSQLPPELPESVGRDRYENFCIDCAECRRQMGGRLQRHRPCYVRWTDRSSDCKDKVQDDIPCAYCGKTISKGTRTVFQEFFASPGSVEVSETSDDINAGPSIATGITVSHTAMHSATGWDNLSPALQRRFRTGGLGRGLFQRSPTMARRIYETQVPQWIRDMGEPAVRDFLDGKDFSHIKSVSSDLRRARWPSNIFLEESGINRSRLSRNVTNSEIAAAQSANKLSAVKVGAKSAVRSGGKAGLIAALVEAVIAVPENALDWKRGRKSGRQAAKDAAKSTATNAAVAAVAQPAMSVAARPLAHIAARVIPAGLGGPLGTAITIASLGLAVYSAGRRLIRAARRDFPFDEYRLFFCAERDCATQFALSVTNEALGVSDVSDWDSGIRLAAIVSICLAIVIVAVTLGWLLT